MTSLTTGAFFAALPRRRLILIVAPGGLVPDTVIVARPDLQWRLAGIAVPDAAIQVPRLDSSDRGSRVNRKRQRRFAEVRRACKGTALVEDGQVTDVAVKPVMVPGTLIPPPDVGTNGRSVQNRCTKRWNNGRTGEGRDDGAADGWDDRAAEGRVAEGRVANRQAMVVDPRAVVAERKTVVGTKVA